MNFLNKIEDAINKAIYAMLATLSKLIPHKFIVFKQKIDHLAELQKQKIRKKIEQTKEDLKHKAHEAQLKLKDQALHLKEKLEQQKEHLTHQVSDLKAIGPKAIIKKICLNLLGLIHKTQQWFESLSPNQMIGGAMVILLIAMGLLFIVTHDKKIEFAFEPKQIVVSRSPAGKQVLDTKEGNIDRPVYHKISQKQFQLNSVHFPVFEQKQPRPKFFSVDVVIELSSRYSAQYLLIHETELRDHILNYIHPIVPQFPLSPEGKEVIRTKMRMEVEIFLKKNMIDAEVHDVLVLNVMAT